MKTSQFRSYIVVFAFLGLCGLEIIALFRAPGWYSNTTILNTLAFIGVSYLSFSQLLGQAHSFLWAVLWSVLVTGPLGWFFGIIAVGLYWYLFLKKKPSTRATRTGSTSTSSASSATSGITCNRVHARLPIVRIPIPWITYIISDKYVTRSSWFGKDATEPFERIENWYISGNGSRAIMGVSVFAFRSKKPYLDDYVIWHLIPTDFAVHLSTMLLQFSKDT